MNEVVCPMCAYVQLVPDTGDLQCSRCGGPLVLTNPYQKCRRWFMFLAEECLIFALFVILLAGAIFGFLADLGVFD